MQKKLALKATLDKAYSEFHSADFIHDDPIQIPHRFTEKRDIEIMAFLASILAWGQRKTIINSCNNSIYLKTNPMTLSLRTAMKTLKNSLVSNIERLMIQTYFTL